MEIIVEFRSKSNLQTSLSLLATLSPSTLRFRDFKRRLIYQMKLMRLVVSDSGSQGNSAIFGLHPRPHEGAGSSPKHDHGCNGDGSKLFKGGVSDHAYGHQPPVIDENLPGMNPSIMPKVEAEVNLQSPASSGEKVGGWRRTWIISLISLFIIVVLRAGSAGLLLVQVGYGERKCGSGGGWIWGKVVRNIY